MHLGGIIISLVLLTVNGFPSPQSNPFVFPTDKRITSQTEETDEATDETDEAGVGDIASPLLETDITESSAFDYLVKYGYAKDNTLSGASGQADFKQKIEQFQAAAGLPMTGKLDAETVEFMEAPRCGGGAKYDENEVDSQTASFGEQAGNKWHKNTLTYRIQKYSKDLSHADVDRTIQRAFKYWTDVADLKFVKTSGGADIEIIFGRRSHGDRQPFDGRGGVLAHAYFPNRFSAIAGDAHFDDDEGWAVSRFRGKQLLQTTTHEFGHSLGLSHSKTRGSVMYPTYPGWSNNLRLAGDDVPRIQRLYGKSKGRGDGGSGGGGGRGGGGGGGGGRPPVVPGNGACVCQDYTRFELKSFKTVGNCRTEYKGKSWCYIDSGANCGDSQTSRKINRKWSWEACQRNTGSDRPTYTGPTVCKEVNINYPGNDLGRSSRQRSWESCRNHCSSSSGCTHWTFRNSDGECWLKTGISQKTNENGLVSGAGKCSATIPGGSPGGNCQCNGVTRFDTRTNKQVGNCNSKYKERYWCYISDASQCGDKKGTKRNGSGLRYYSFSACESQTQFQRDTVAFQIEELPEAQFDPLVPEAQVEGGDLEESP